MPPSLDTTLGALLVGHSTSLVLLGVALVQLHTYFKLFPAKSDHWIIRALVAFSGFSLLSCEIALTCGLYAIVVRSFGSPHFLDKFPLAFDIAIVFGSVIDSVIQLFFVHRVWRTTQNVVLSGVMLALLLARTAVTLAIATRTFSMVNLHSFVTENGAIFVTSWTVSITLDVLIATALCIDLWRRRRNALKQTMRVIDQAIIWSIETGLTTGIAGFIVTICYFQLRSTAVWLAVYMQIPGLFCNMLFLTLNNRTRLRTMISEGPITLEYMGTSAPNEAINRDWTRNTERNLTIGVSTTVVKEHDGKVVSELA